MSGIGKLRGLSLVVATCCAGSRSVFEGRRLDLRPSRRNGASWGWGVVEPLLNRQRFPDRRLRFRPPGWGSRLVYSAARSREVDACLQLRSPRLWLQPCRS